MASGKRSIGQLAAIPAPSILRAAIEAVRIKARGCSDPSKPIGKRGRVLIDGEPIGDTATACAVLGLRRNTLYIALARGYAVANVRIPIAYERGPVPEAPDRRRGTAEPVIHRGPRPVWSDVPGEYWPRIKAAAAAVGRAPSAISQVVDDPVHRSAGRLWFSKPPAWVAEAERQRSASVRCNPGRAGRVFNGTDSRTGIVYVNGEPAGRALAGLAKGAAA